ncbi:MAG: response regulator [Candidatus Acidiferrales bacterium]
MPAPPSPVEDVVEERDENVRTAAALATVEPCADPLPPELDAQSLAELWAPNEPTLHFAAHSVADDIDLSDPLAILRQAMDPASQIQHLSHVPKMTLGWISRPLVSVPDSPDADDSTLIGAKVHCDVSGTFLTETMDLEAIVASAREEGSSARAGLTCVAEEERSVPSATLLDEIDAEVSAVAEEFVAERRHQAHAPAAHISSPAAPSATNPSAHSTSAAPSDPPRDRRRKRRAMISAPIRVRNAKTEGGHDEIATTVDVSRTGILFHSQRNTYTRGMEVAVVFPYSQAPSATHFEQTGRVVRINDLGDGTFDVAIALSAAASEDSAAATPACASPETKKPMVLAVDADESLRDSLKIYLQNEGYDVIAVNNAADAREVLNIFTPALIIAEVEGEGTPGYDLCAHVKSSHQWRRIPVVLTTSSAYPSDYSNAHSLGAIVCMAKPYKQERLGHIVRLLAPLPEHLQNSVAPHAADPTRVPGRDGNWASRNLRLVRGNGNGKKSGNGNGSKMRFRFPSFR